MDFFDSTRFIEDLDERALESVDRYRLGQFAGKRIQGSAIETRVVTDGCQFLDEVADSRLDSRRGQRQLFGIGAETEILLINSGKEFRVDPVPGTNQRGHIVRNTRMTVGQMTVGDRKMRWDRREIVGMKKAHRFRGDLERLSYVIEKLHGVAPESSPGKGALVHFACDFCLGGGKGFANDTAKNPVNSA
jgi:hypothetical protein